MKTSQILHFSQRKLQSYRGKTLFLMVPITVLLIVGIVLSSQVANIEAAMNKSIFGTIEEQGKIIELEKAAATSSSGSGDRTMRISGQTDLFQESDLDKVKKIEGVANADLLNTVPLGQVITTNLVDGAKINLNAITGLDSGLGAQYTDQDFSYTENGVIPIIISTGALVEQYEDWGGQNSITADFGRRTTGGGGGPVGPGSIGPNKTRSLTATKEQLMGKTFTGSIGGLDALQTFTTSAAETGITFTKKTAEELATAEADRKTSISKYWNYDALATPTERTFKIVGVIEDGEQNGVYIPQAAAAELMKTQIQKQLDARTTTTVPTSDLNSTYTGTTFDGLVLSQGFSVGGRAIRFGGPAGGSGGRGGAISIAGDSSESASYRIPGLVIETGKSSDVSNPFETGDVVGIYTDTAVYEKANRSSGRMLVQTNSVSDRDKVVEALNDAGYTYRDTQKLSVLTDLKERLHLFTTIFLIAFIALVGLVLALSLSRFIAESRREIAIFRVIGATKNQIRQLILGQALLASLVSCVAGVLVGLGAAVALAGPIHSWFSNLVTTTLGATYPKITIAEIGVFRGISWASVGIYVGLLILCTVVVGIVMSTTATKVKPAEGVRER